MAVYYKFKSAKDYDYVPIDGHFISVVNLKERIFESKRLGGGTDFDIVVSNAQTSEEYVDEAAMIPKNTSVLIRRIPGQPRKPIVAEEDEPKVVEDRTEQPPPPSNTVTANSSAVKYLEESEWDVFGGDLYALPEDLPPQSRNPVSEVSPASKMDEENKIKALVETSALDWNCQGQDAYGGGRGFGRGMGGRMMNGRGFGRGGYERKTPPVGYICYRCKVPGHFIQHCPTNGDSNYDIRKVKAPTGIPKSMLMATPDGSYMLPSGAVAVLKPNQSAFDKEVEGLPSNRPVIDLPPEFRCPLCKEVMKDAVLTGKCCFSSFCDKCIRDYIIMKSMCVCGVALLADDLLPNVTLRDAICRMLESTTNSTENAGRLLHIQDTESARHMQLKVPSPTLSAASKAELRWIPPVEHSSDVKVGHVKEGDAAGKGKAVNDVNHSLDKKTPKNADPSETAPEAITGKDPILPETAPVAEEVQEKLPGGDQGKKKKKKKIHLPSNADSQWTYQDLGAENYAGMPLAPAAYNPYWSGGMPMGTDGFMAPFGVGMSYMGYTPAPFDVPFAGMLPHDPFGAQGYMMGFPPRDLSELGMGLNQGPPMSRGDFEAMKADPRRKRREFERLNERQAGESERR
ncbi:E3 ubiquitin ligase PQT3-like [Iris pallida]|uniref:E3 ubiquitin ligase PQT3-like n=1 Tax=Iris pallida TaxID=29817 RepID=A0AAX6GEB1_IRIPA|nr:E3 ubiquitin ligase PQT3-like [Iris pallida]